jgi:hypothetical protein
VNGDDLAIVIPRVEFARMHDLAGKKFGRLTVLARHGARASGEATWLCECECGERIVRAGSNLRRGHVKSCGCFRREMSRRSTGVKHGESASPSVEYRTWERMISRCENPRASGYENYGGRGITICAEWRHDYSAFLAAMGRRPGAAYSLDRIDNDGNYEPGNCRWATRAEQNRNKRRAQR